MVRILFELNGHIEELATELRQKHRLNLRATVRNDFHQVEVLLTDPGYPFEKDWMPQMCFIIMLQENKILLKYLRLPKSLRSKGIGSLCFTWLIELCKLYGIDEIHGEAAEGSEDFWSKLGCIHTPGRSYYSVKDNSEKPKIPS